MAPPIDSTRFEQIKASGDLPSPKGVALAIMRLANQDDVSMPEMARIIRTDPAFVGRLIKAANGVIGYGRRPIASVQDALTVLGMPAVRTMALGFSLLTNYRVGTCQEFNYAHFWSSCLAAAVMTQLISLKTRAAAPDEIYCLGLLSRIGELALVTLYPAEYGAILRELAADSSLNQLELESRRFGMNHAELGAAMLADWGMPRVFTEAAYQSAISSDHDYPEGSRERAVSDTLLLANATGALCVAPEQERSVLTRRMLMLGSRLSFDEAATTELCDSTVKAWLDWCVLLNVEASPLPSFESLHLAVVEADALAPPQPEALQDALAPTRHVVPHAAPTKPRVLLAMPDTVVRTAIEKLLQDASYEVSTAKDTGMAIELVIDYEPDMLIIDDILLEQGGENLLVQIRHTRIGRGLFVLLLGQRVDEEFKVLAYEQGADDVVEKPVSPRLLLARLNAGRRISSLHQELERDREEMRHFAAELAVSNRRLQEVAMIDPLTGFPNRRLFVDRMLQEWAASTRNRRPLSCIVIDLDHFRRVNDAYGPEVGDSVLRQVCQSIRLALRTQDLVARTGGDEFLVMCPDTAIESAQACAERLRAAVESADIVSGMLRLKLTISLGVATRDSSINDADILIRRAEYALEVAKKEGRNRISNMQLHATGG
jgi:two-component system, cell cycle response regulator